MPTNRQMPASAGPAIANRKARWSGRLPLAMVRAVARGTTGVLFASLTLSACGQGEPNPDDPLLPRGDKPPLEEQMRMFPPKPVIPADSIVPVEPGYFRPPVDIPVGLGGTFGELRPSHFHSGIDIRTNGQEGLTVRSCADGFVSRIKVSPHGYGNALYIDHPNGYTTVYAHLKQFAEPMASYVRQLQYANESFELDVYPEDSLFPVTKGVAIARSGNSGRSTSPHLHFEIRETESEWPVNPVLITNWVTDDIPPVISKLWQYSAPMVTGMGDGTAQSVVAAGRGVYRMADTLVVNMGEIVFGIEVADRHNGNSGNNDINTLELWVDGEQLYGWNLKKISFDYPRCINSHIDYGRKHKGGSMVHRLFKAPGTLMTAHTYDGSGVVPLYGKTPRQVEIRVRDGSGNLGQLKFWVRGVPNPPTRTKPQDTLAYSKIDSVTTATTTWVFLPNTFANPIRRDDILAENNCLIPIQREFQIIRRAAEVPERLIDKVLIVRRDPHSASRTALRSTWTDGYIEAASTQLGQFAFDYDTIAPRITLISSTRSSIVLTITDNLSGIAEYDAYIDGQWVLPVYDAKTNRVTHTFEGTLAAGKHEFKLVVTDVVGNVAERVVSIMR